MVDAGPAAMAGPMTRPRRARRRRWPWVLAVVFVLLLVALVIADRVAVSAADAAVEKRLAEQAPFGASNKPDVSIRGFPFLTQALSGKYDDIEVSGDSLRLEQVSGVDFDAHMHGVHVPLSKALRRPQRRLARVGPGEHGGPVGHGRRFGGCHRPGQRQPGVVQGRADLRGRRPAACGLGFGRRIADGRCVHVAVPALPARGHRRDGNVVRCAGDRPCRAYRRRRDYLTPCPEKIATRLASAGYRRLLLRAWASRSAPRSEEHTSELQSHVNL